MSHVAWSPFACVWHAAKADEPMEMPAVWGTFDGSKVWDSRKGGSEQAMRTFAKSRA